MTTETVAKVSYEDLVKAVTRLGRENEALTNRVKTAESDVARTVNENARLRNTIKIMKTSRDEYAESVAKVRLQSQSMKHGDVTKRVKEVIGSVIAKLQTLA